LAYTGGKLELPNFDFHVVVDLAGLSYRSESVPVRFNHDGERGVGHTVSITNDGSQIIAYGIISRATVDAKDVTNSGLLGFPWQASIGCDVLEKRFIPQGASEKINGRDIDGPCIVASKTFLREITICEQGADDNTRVVVSAKKTENSITGVCAMTFSEWMATKNIDESSLSEDQLTVLKIVFECETDLKDDESSDAPVDEGSEVVPELSDSASAVRASALAEKKRINAIHNICNYGHGREFPEIEAAAIEEGWGLQKTELEVLRASRPNIAAIINTRRTAAGANSKVIEAAIRLNSTERSEIVEKAYSQEILEAASKYRQMGIKRLFEECCLMEGKSISAARSSERELIQAAFSTASLPTIMYSTMSKVLLDSYRAVPSVAREVSKKLTANDFKTHTGLRLTGDSRMLEVGADGEIKHGNLGESAYPFRVNTVARKFGITRQMLLNDDIGALMEIPQMLGRGAAVAVEEAFWKLVLSNANNFFSTGNTNIVSGATSVLGIAGLARVVQAFRDQTDESGIPILLTPRFLVVPTSLEVKARELFVSTNIIAVGTGPAESVRGDANIFSGMYQPLVSPYLNNPLMTNASDTSWYLFSDPIDVAAFGIAYLRGNESPQIEEFEQLPDVLGTGWRGYFDFGVCQLDPRGAVKSTGA
jgi:hypothetical protein